MTPTHDRAAWLQGRGAVCNLPPPEVKRTWRLVLLGPPGAGKGTLASQLHHALGACPLSTGDVFRAARGQSAPPGSAMADAQVHMDRGHLVPDATVLMLLRERSSCLHCRGGFMLDGFPRTVAQAEALDQLLTSEDIELDAVINLNVPDDQLIARLSGRRVCPKCKAVFHVANQKPRVEGVCDACGARLVQRPDDSAESVSVRLEAYHDATEPLIGHYRAQGRLVAVDAAGAPNAVLARTLDALFALGLSD